MEKFKNALRLFLTFFKIGLFTFGGGYSMISIIQNECIEKKKWTTYDEFLNCVALAESTPGPIAINTATYIGFKVAGFWGSFFATLGVTIPSFIIIFIISLFFNNLLEIEVIAHAFQGIKICVALLIMSAGVKMFIKAEKKPIPLIIIFATFTAMILIDVFAINFSSIFIILIGAALGILFYAINQYKTKQKNKELPPLEVQAQTEGQEEENKDEHLS